MFQTFDKKVSNSIPTWDAFNSLLNPLPEISICQGLLLYPSPPSDWSYLYAALKIVQGINIVMTEKINLLFHSTYNYIQSVCKRETILTFAIVIFSDLHDVMMNYMMNYMISWQ